MAETYRVTHQQQNADEWLKVRSLKKASWQHKNVEEKIRKKLAEFASELESFKRLRRHH